MPAELEPGYYDQFMDWLNRAGRTYQEDVIKKLQEPAAPTVATPTTPAPKTATPSAPPVAVPPVPALPKTATPSAS